MALSNSLSIFYSFCHWIASLSYGPVKHFRNNCEIVEEPNSSTNIGIRVKILTIDLVVPTY